VEVACNLSMTNAMLFITILGVSLCDASGLVSGENFLDFFGRPGAVAQIILPQKLLLGPPFD
jgi:hypothetical protein